MAWVKTFRITTDYGVPDKDIKEWISTCEKSTIVNVSIAFIPSVGKSDPRICVIVTKLDDKDG